MAATVEDHSTPGYSTGSEDVVDVVVLSRPHSVPCPEVIDAIRNQQSVTTRVHHHTGWPERKDANRWVTIARARNEMKRYAVGRWVMFVDDDVVLADNCIATLLGALNRGASLGAIAADYTGESTTGDWNGHVAMGACLFRRKALEAVDFRNTSDHCECWCCCHDLRSLGIGITYCREAFAYHLNHPVGSGSARVAANSNRPGCVLAAFDRRDIQRFVLQFLRSLRASGNNETVFAAVYGLYPSELRRLEKLKNVHLFPSPSNGQMAPIRRLYDFSEIAAQLPGDTPIAYWDVADVIFQTDLGPLWDEVRRHPNQIGAVIEPKSYPENEIVIPWTFSISDPFFRQQTFDLLKNAPFLNSGFAAGTASAMTRYFRDAHRMRFGPELSGSTDWGDQMCLNRYCHFDASRWWALNQGWNYCIHDRPEGEVWVTASGEVMSGRIGRVPIAHGNARSLRQFSILVNPGFAAV